MVKQGQLYQVLLNWSSNGANSAFTFQDLIDHTALNEDAPAMVRTALGSKWSLWFIANPPATTVVPRQVALLLLAGLERMKIQYESKETKDEIAKQATDSYAAITEVAKKRRALLFDEPMPPAATAAASTA